MSLTIPILCTNLIMIIDYTVTNINAELHDGNSFIYLIPRIILTLIRESHLDSLIFTDNMSLKVKLMLFSNIFSNSCSALLT